MALRLLRGMVAGAAASQIGPGATAFTRMQHAEGWRGLAGHLLNLDDAPAEDNLVGDALQHNRWELHPADYLAIAY